MIWPTYPEAPGLPKYLTRHNAHQTGAQRPLGRPGVYGCAVDVWRDGAHLWRSYAPAMGETADAWSERTWRAEHGDAWPKDHQSGPWAAPGVPDLLLSPVPTVAALAHVGAAQDVFDLLAALVAIGDWPAEPPREPVSVPSANGISVSLSRDPDAWITACVVNGPVTVRAMIGRCAPVRDVEAVPVTRWAATLARRSTRAGALDTRLPEQAVTFDAPTDAPPHILARRAKMALGINGHQAQRVPGSMIWHLARAPYQMTIDSLPTDS